MTDTFKSCPRCESHVRNSPPWPWSLSTCTGCSGLLWHSADRDSVAAATLLDDSTQMPPPLTIFYPGTRFESELALLIPHSIARENNICAIGESDSSIVIAASDFSDREAFSKLKFVLSRQVACVLTPLDWIRDMIQIHYGHA